MTDLTEHEILVEPRYAPETPVGRTTGWWAMVLFIATESATFAACLASYFYLRFSAKGPWPPAADKPPDLLLPSIATGVLVVSCLPMLLGSALAGRRSRGGAALGTVGALVGGVAFVVLQVLDWRSEWPDSTLSKDAYGSLLYAITGLHTAHVVVGIGLLIFLLASLAVRRSAARPRGPVYLVSLYWYFLAVVAIAVYVTVYITPNV